MSKEVVPPLGARRPGASGAPVGVKAFEYRRVKNDLRDATDLADLLLMGRLPEAWISPPATREVRELVRHRAKLVGLRTHCKCEVHAVLAKCGVQVLMRDPFGPAGQDLLDRCPLPGPFGARVQSLLRLIDDLQIEIDLFARLTRGRLAGHPGYTGLQQLPGIGPVLAAVLVAEVGDVTRFQRASQLACWAGLTPKHRESDTSVHRGRITKQGSRTRQGSRLVRWALVESVKRLGPTGVVGSYKKQVADRRGKNIGTVAAARKQAEFVFYGCAITTSEHSTRHARRGHRSGQRHETPALDGRARGRAGHDPRPSSSRGFSAWSPLLIDPDRPSSPSSAKPIMRPLANLATATPKG